MLILWFDLVFLGYAGRGASALFVLRRLYCFVFTGFCVGNIILFCVYVYSLFYVYFDRVFVVLWILYFFVLVCLCVGGFWLLWAFRRCCGFFRGRVGLFVAGCYNGGPFTCGA